MNTEPVRIGEPTYAGSYRIVYFTDGSRRLEVRRGHRWARIKTPIPAHIRGAYAAANYVGV